MPATNDLESVSTDYDQINPFLESRIIILY